MAIDKTKRIALEVPDFQEPRWDIPLNRNWENLDLLHGKIPEINKILEESTSIIDVFIYDTSLDPDDGLWRDYCAGLSWYNEELNTETRGRTRKFPAVALIVAETNKVTIYDATEPDTPMWMVFNSSSLNMVYGSILQSISFLAGTLCVCTINGGVSVISFVSDNRVAYSTGTRYLYLGGIIDRNSSKGAGSNLGSPGLVNNSGNDVAMTVLDGNDYPTIAVATDGGISVIDGPVGKGTVVDITATTEGYDHSYMVECIEDGKILFSLDSVDNARFIHVFEIPLVDTVIAYTGGHSLEIYVSFKTGSSYLVLLPDDVTTIKRNAVGSTDGLNLLKENPMDPQEGMVNYVTDTYQSGWQQGDIKLATLADTESGTVTSSDSIADRSHNNNPLQVVGQLTKEPVATGSELMAYSGFSSDNYIEQPYNADLDFGTGDFYVMGWVKNESSLNQEQHIISRGADNDGLYPHLKIYYTPSIETLTFKVRNTLDDQIAVTTNLSVYSFITAIRSSGDLFLYVNGEEVGTFTGRYQDMTIPDSVLRLGQDDGSPSGTAQWYGGISLLRIGAGAPSEDQIKHIYETEKKLFEPDAKCTLNGSGVNALSLDNNILSVATLTSIDRFVDCVNVETTAVDDVNSIHTLNSCEIYGTDENSVYSAPEVNLLEESFKNKSSFEMPFPFKSTGSGQTQIKLPDNKKAVQVFDSGVLVDFTKSYDGFNNYVNITASTGDVVIMVVQI